MDHSSRFASLLVMAQLALVVTPGLVAGIATGSAVVGFVTRALVRLAARRND